MTQSEPRRNPSEVMSGCARVEPDVRRTGHLWISNEPRVNDRIRNDQRLVLLNRVSAERDVAIDIRCIDVHPDAGFEPLTMRVNETHQRDRHAEKSGGQSCDSVEASLGRGIQDCVAPKRLQTLCLIRQKQTVHNKGMSAGFGRKVMK